MMLLEIVLFMFLRSLSEANFEMLVTHIKAIVPWMFALVYYARCLPVYLRDLENLHDHTPSLYSFQMDILLSRRKLTIFPALP